MLSLLFKTYIHLGDDVEPIVSLYISLPPSPSRSNMSQQHSKQKKLSIKYYNFLFKERKKLTKVECSMKVCKSNKPVTQAAGQTLHDATPPVGEILPISKIAVTIEPIQRSICSSRFRISEKI